MYYRHKWNCKFIGLKVPLQVLIFLSLMLAPVQLILAQNNKFEPEDGRKLLVIGQDIDAVGGTAQYTDGYVDHFQMPAGFITYSAIPEVWGLFSIVDYGAGPLFADTYKNDSKFDGTVLTIGVAFINQSVQIANGNYDGQIRTMANWCKNFGKPIFLRPGFEFNFGPNGYGEGPEYAAAYRRIVDIFRAENVNNVAFVWQATTSFWTCIEDYWPGADYVDWVAWSDFNAAPLSADSYKSNLVYQVAEAFDKPIMIAEITLRGQPMDNLENSQQVWETYYLRWLNVLKELPRVKAFCYINQDWRKQPLWINNNFWVNTNSRIQDDQLIAEKWEEVFLQDPMWIQAEDNVTSLIRMEDSEPFTGNTMPLIDWGGPIVDVVKKDAKCDLENGSLTLNFVDNPEPDRTTIQISINGGESFPYSTSDQAGFFALEQLTPGDYNIHVRWSDDQCTRQLGIFTIANLTGGICNGEVETPDVPVEIYLEAECANQIGKLWNQSTDTEAGQESFIQVQKGINSYSSPANGPDGLLSYTFDVPVEGTYKVWGRVKTPNTNDDSFWFRIDNQKWVRWNDLPHSSTWVWDEVHNSDELDIPIIENLSSGTHTLTVSFREDGAGLDQIFITNTNNIPSGVADTTQPCNANNQPLAGFTADTFEGIAPLNITFDASESVDKDGDSLTYSWDFGNGDTATGKEVSYTYPLIGEYTVTLTVKDQTLTDQTSKTSNSECRSF